MSLFRGDREPVGCVSDWNGRGQEPLCEIRIKVCSEIFAGIKLCEFKNMDIFESITLCEFKNMEAFGTIKKRLFSTEMKTYLRKK